MMFPKEVTVAKIDASTLTSIAALCLFSSSVTTSSVSSLPFRAVIGTDLSLAQSAALLALLAKHKAYFDSCAMTLNQTTLAVHRIQADAPGVIRR